MIYVGSWVVGVIYTVVVMLGWEVEGMSLFYGFF